MTIQFNDAGEVGSGPHTLSFQREQDEQRRARIMADAFHGACHTLNYDHILKMQAPPQAVSSKARQLLCILRDETQSKSIYEECVAIVGERTP